MDMKQWHKFAFLALLTLIGITGRIISGMGFTFNGMFAMDMFALVSISALVAGYVTRSPWALFVPISIMFVSDITLYFMGTTSGYSSLFLLGLAFFVWTGFALISLLGNATSRMSSSSSVLWFLGGSIWSVLIFDTWTNFGFYLIFFPHTISGLMLCFTAAIPFTLGHLLTTMILAPLGYLVARWGRDTIFTDVSENTKETVVPSTTLEGYL